MTQSSYILYRSGNESQKGPRICPRSLSWTGNGKSRTEIRVSSLLIQAPCPSHITPLVQGYLGTSQGGTLLLQVEVIFQLEVSIGMFQAKGTACAKTLRQE